jgi:hypothetical protein
MQAIHIRRKLDSDTPHLPELRPLIGKTVEIIVQEAPDPARADRWKPLSDIAGQDLIDPDVYKEQRALETARMQATNNDSG